MRIKSKITITWHIEDVQEVRPDLTNRQASEVLQATERYYDANHGINWQTLEDTADMLFPDPQQPRLPNLLPFAEVAGAVATIQ